MSNSELESYLEDLDNRYATGEIDDWDYSTFKFLAEVKSIYCHEHEISDKLLSNEWKFDLEDCKSIGKHLSNNKETEKLDLKDRYILDEGILLISEALKENNVLLQLMLSENHISDFGASCLGKALAQNTTLGELYLEGNAIGDNGASCIADSLTHNETLQILFLQSNLISDIGGTLLKNGVLANSNLKAIYVEGNKISKKVEDEIHRAIKTKDNIKDEPINNVQPKGYLQKARQKSKKSRDGHSDIIVIPDNSANKRKLLPYQATVKCGCCHACRKSLNKFPGPHMECSTCSYIVCKPCFDKGRVPQTWEEAQKLGKQWSCFVCHGVCQCKRCQERGPRWYGQLKKNKQGSFTHIIPNNSTRALENSAEKLESSALTLNDLTNQLPVDDFRNQKKKEQIKKKKKKLSEIKDDIIHQHPVDETGDTKGTWSCDNCGNTGSVSYSCIIGCDFDYCEICYEKLKDQLPTEDDNSYTNSKSRFLKKNLSTVTNNGSKNKSWKNDDTDRSEKASRFTRNSVALNQMNNSSESQNHTEIDPSINSTLNPTYSQITEISILKKQVENQKEKLQEKIQEFESYKKEQEEKTKKMEYQVLEKENKQKQESDSLKNKIEELNQEILNLRKTVTENSIQTQQNGKNNIINNQNVEPQIKQESLKTENIIFENLTNDNSNNINNNNNDEKDIILEKKRIALKRSSPDSCFNKQNKKLSTQNDKLRPKQSPNKKRKI